MQYEKNMQNTQINTNESTHSEMGPVWQNPIQRTVRTAHLEQPDIITIAQTSPSGNSNDCMNTFLWIVGPRRPVSER